MHSTNCKCRLSEPSLQWTSMRCTMLVLTIAPQDCALDSERSFGVEKLFKAVKFILTATLHYMTSIVKSQTAVKGGDGTSHHVTEVVAPVSTYNYKTSPVWTSSSTVSPKEDIINSSEIIWKMLVYSVARYAYIIYDNVVFLAQNNKTKNKKTKQGLHSNLNFKTTRGCVWKTT